MIKLYINSGDASSYLDDSSLSIIDQIQNKANTANFSLRPGVTRPSENQEVKIWDTMKLVSLSSTALVIQDNSRTGISALTYGKYRAGDYIWLGVGTANEERATISSLEAGTGTQINITLTAVAANSHSANEECGKLLFGGTLTTVKDANVKLLTNIEYTISATDFTKVFDKKNLNDSWADADARYIINDALDTTINYNSELDDLDYADNTAVQAEWIESGDGTNPTVDTSDFLQGTSAVDFPWTNSGGTATFSATPSSRDIDDLTGAATGAPTKGNVTFWYKRATSTGITTLKIRVGSDASNYTEVTCTPEADTDWHFKSLPLENGTTTGTPNWAAVDYLAVIVAETTTSSIKMDDIRCTADGSFTMYNFLSTETFDDARASFKKPTVFIQELADSLSYYWYVDYERDVHFFSRETTDAPFDVDDDGDTYDGMTVEVNTSQLKNRQVVRGGTKTSDSFYKQVVQGDDATREWIMKSQFVNLSIYLDDNTSTDTCEAGTDATTINATAHGLTTGDWIVNRTRGAAREVTVVTADQFTVLEVTGQVSTDTFSKFATTEDVGVENLVDETTVDYVSNFENKSIRASSTTITPTSTDYLLFVYNEIIPIRVEISDPASIAALKALVGGDGIFDGAVITDTSLTSLEAARDRAQAEVTQYSNPITKVTFKTNYEGLKSGQLIRVTDTERGVDDTYLIQRVKSDYKVADFPLFEAQCASSLFGIIEYFQQLSQSVADRTVDEDDVIDQIVSENVTITITESDTIGATHEVTESATITVTPSETATERDITTDPFEWGPTASDNRWNLNQWG